jgi:hypothetical protein
MRTKSSQFFFPLFLFSLGACAAPGCAQVKSILKVDAWSQGPLAGQKSISCLTVYSDGKVNFFHRWNSGKVRIDAKTRKKALLERVVCVESHLNRADLFEVSGFLKSDVIRVLEKSFVIPHPIVDYAEGATVCLGGPVGNEKCIEIREYDEAGLEQKGQLPGALIVLMDKIEEIEKAAVLKGKATKIPSNCSVPD